MHPYKNSALPVEERVADLIGRMTIEEKIGQCVQSFGGEFGSKEKYLEAISTGKIGSHIMVTTQWAGNDGVKIINTDIMTELQRAAVEGSRLGIPLINGRDIIHGHRTVSPIPLAQAASFDREDVKKSAAIAAKEASAECVHWTFAPMMDICRDPRWGRVIETLGEDPFLAEELAVAMTKGFQGDDMTNPESIVACAKHFAGYGYAEGGRDYDCTEISDYTMYNTVLRPFRAVTERAEIGTFMTSFQVNNGIPSSSSKFLLTEILRDTWGFKGFVVSDWGAVEQVELHGACQDEKDAARKCFKAGCDMEMLNNLYTKYIPELLDEGELTMEELDRAVCAILRIKFEAGLFENPYTDAEARAKDIMAPAHLAAVREQAANCMVLAKNNGILPLSDLKGKKIALIGPFVNEKLALLGSWNLAGLPEETASIAEAFTEIADEYGFELILPQTQLHDEQIRIAQRQADMIICCIGEHAALTGEDRATCNFGLSWDQQQLLEMVNRIGKPFVVLCSSGRPLPIPEAEQYADALLYTWHCGTETARAIADVVMGKAEPGGRFPITVPRFAGQIPIYYGRKVPGKEMACHRNSEEPEVHAFYDGDVFKPMHPFGYGLSYTTFELSEAKLAANEINIGQANSIKVTVSNTGDRAGSTVVQCYLRDPRASFARPYKELIGFEKVYLDPGKSLELEFPITDAAMGFYTDKGKFIVEPGEFHIGVGFDSNVKLDKKFSLK